MVIREAKREDFVQLSKLFNQVDKLHSSAHPDIFNESMTDARSYMYLSSIIDDVFQMLLVACIDDKIVGLAKASIDKAPDIPLFVSREWLSIDTIVVNEKHRGGGVGQSLLDNLYEWAMSKNIQEVELSVYSFNNEAINFYEKNGYEEIRRKLRKKLY